MARSSIVLGLVLALLPAFSAAMRQAMRQYNQDDAYEGDRWGGFGGYPVPAPPTPAPVPRHIDFTELRKVAHTEGAMLANYSKAMAVLDDQIVALDQKIRELTFEYNQQSGQYRQTKFLVETNFNQVLANGPEMKPGEVATCVS